MREMLKEEAVAQIKNKRPIDPYNKYPQTVSSVQQAQS